MDCGLWIADSGMGIVDSGMGIADSRYVTFGDGGERIGGGISDPTGSGRTEGRVKDRVRRTAINSPHQNACRRDEYENRGDLRRLEPSWRIRAFQRTSDRDEGELSNISSKVCSYEYRRYIY